MVDGGRLLPGWQTVPFLIMWVTLTPTHGSSSTDRSAGNALLDCFSSVCGSGLGHPHGAA
jgi:hypothetical protein